jgi:hypothetical protein
MKARAVALALWALTAAGGLVIVATAIIGLDPAARDAAAVVTVFTLIAFDALVCTTVGVLIVLRRPGNLVGWTLGALGVGLVLTFAGFGSAGLRVDQVGLDDKLAGLFLWTGVVAFNPTIALVGLVMLLFPDGHLPSPRWRAPVGALSVLILAATLLIAIKPGEFDPTLPPNPFGLDHPVVETLAPIALAVASIGSLATILLGAIAVGSRFFRARGDTRQQLKWFLGAVALVAMSIVPGIVLNSTPLTPTADSGSQEFGLLDVVGSASLALVPIAIGVAILRYRLSTASSVVPSPGPWSRSCSSRCSGRGSSPSRASSPASRMARPWRSPVRRLLPSRSSSRFAGGSRGWSIGDSTALATTPASSSKAWQSGCATRWSSRPWASRSCEWRQKRSVRPAPPSGYGIPPNGLAVGRARSDCRSGPQAMPRAMVISGTALAYPATTAATRATRPATTNHVGRSLRLVRNDHAPSVARPTANSATPMSPVFGPERMEMTTSMAMASPTIVRAP